MRVACPSVFFYGNEQIWQDARFTGVFEKRKGRWVMVQTHVSLPESAQAGER